jgi:hypothetical protein
MILVSFHGGDGSDGVKPCHKGKDGTPYNNLRAYDDNGSELNQGVAILQGENLDLSELRGMAVAPNDYLWVASGGKAASTILAFERDGTPTNPYWTWQGTVKKFCYPKSPLLHPFDLSFDETASNCYVSNQDTDVVARLEQMDAKDYTSAEYADWPPFLQNIPNANFLAGTFVASSDGRLPDKNIDGTTPVAEDAGLAIKTAVVKKNCKVVNSVRGVLWLKGLLYVADEVAGYIKMYSADGTYLGKSTYQGQRTPLGSPVHLLYHPGSDSLCVSSGDSILYAPVDEAPETLDFRDVQDLPPGLTSVSGMSLSPAGDLYVGSRTGCRCWCLKDFSPEMTQPPQSTCWDVTDNPEFLLWVPDS